MSALEGFDTFLDKNGWTLYSLVPIKTMGMKGEDLVHFKLLLFSPEGRKVSFLSGTIEDAIAGAIMLINSPDKAHLEGI